MWWTELIFFTICSLLAIGFYTSVVFKWSAECPGSMFVALLALCLAPWQDLSMRWLGMRWLQGLSRNFSNDCEVQLESSFCNKKTGRFRFHCSFSSGRHVEAVRAQRCHSPHVKWEINVYFCKSLIYWVICHCSISWVILWKKRMLWKIYE